jgi:hypothetical protein
MRCRFTTQAGKSSRDNDGSGDSSSNHAGPNGVVYDKPDLREKNEVDSDYHYFEYCGGGFRCAAIRLV